MRTTPSRAAMISTAILLSATVIVASCADSQDGDTADHLDLQTAIPAAAGDIDLVTWNLSGGEPATLDPVGVFSGSELEVGSNLCESLLTLTSDGDVEPLLAASIDQPSPTEYVVNLRDDVTFSDGSAMTAEDVVFSLERMLDPDLGSYWGYFGERVDSVTLVDVHTVRIDMALPDAVFYRMLATPLGQVVEKDFVESAGEDYGSPDAGVMCTGPYTLSDWNAGESLTITARDDWWRADQQPIRTKAAKFTFLTDDATITSALVNGDLDGDMNLASSSLPQLTKASNGQVYVGPSPMQFVIVPTNLSAESTSALADQKIRAALAQSIDYDGLLSTIWAGLSEPLRTIVPPGAWGHSKDIFQAAYDEFPDPKRDLDAAKKLLEEAGNTSPHVTLAIPADIPMYVAIGEAIQSNAKDAGFDFELRSLAGAEASALFSSQDARDQVDAFLTDYFSDIPEPLQLYMQIGTPDGASNYNLYDNPEVAALLDEARGTLDDADRAELTVEAQALMTTDLVWIPIAYPLQSAFVTNKVGGVPSSATAVLHTSWLTAVGSR